MHVFEPLDLSPVLARLGSLKRDREQIRIDICI